MKNRGLALSFLEAGALTVSASGFQTQEERDKIRVEWWIRVCRTQLPTSQMILGYQYLMASSILLPIFSLLEPGDCFKCMSLVT